MKCRICGSIDPVYKPKSQVLEICDVCLAECQANRSIFISKNSDKLSDNLEHFVKASAIIFGIRNEAILSHMKALRSAQSVKEILKVVEDFEKGGIF